jgi:hypothetical protein
LLACLPACLPACSDWEASRRLLPPLASSLAYSNYSSWQAQHEGQALPQVAPGVSIQDLYKAAEREVRRGSYGMHYWWWSDAGEVGLGWLVG